VAPVTRRSGKSCVVVRRYTCNKRLANALYHWARVAIQHDEPSRCRYAALPRGTSPWAEGPRRGHRHGRALRTIADRLLAVACTLLDRKILFDPNHKAREAAVA
jgi:Transposase IS116/IS110/IS902 family